MQKKFLMILASLMLFSAPAYAAEVNGYGIVDATKLNIRTSPNTNASIKSTLCDGEVVEIVTKTGEWYEILFEGESFYVHADYIIPSRKPIEAKPKPQPEPQRPIPEKPYIDQSASGKEKAAAVVEYAKEFLGIPYLWGGESPEEGFDCSGLVYYVYGQFGVDLYRVAKDMMKNGTEVPLDNLEPGDIVLFWNQESYSEINHVGIYVGDGMFIHAPQTGDVVKFTTLESGYYSRTKYAARRIFE